MANKHNEIIYPEIEIGQWKEAGYLCSSISTKVRIKNKNSSIYYLVNVQVTKVDRNTGDSLKKVMECFQREVAKVQHLYRVNNFIYRDGEPVCKKDISKEKERDRIERLYT